LAGVGGEGGAVIGAGHEIGLEIWNWTQA